MKVSKISMYDTAQWDGVNTSVFFTGCTHHCPGCFNEDIWDFSQGVEFDNEMEDTIIKFVSNKHVDGLCILGGEPFQQDLTKLYKLVCLTKAYTNKPIHIWSGYTIEELAEIPGAYDILRHCDTLVDGRFDISKKNMSLKYRGSSNQRVIILKEVDF